MTTTRPTYGSAPISDTGLPVPRDISMRIASLADSTGLTVPSSAWIIPAAVSPKGAAPVQMALGGADQDKPGIGHNSGAQAMPDDDEAKGIAPKKAYYIEVLTDWFANRRERTSEYMTPEDIGACETRPALLLHAMAIGIASIYREALFNPESTESPEERVRGAFFMMGVYVVDIYLSHNDKGCSTASAERVAELLGCSKNSVKRARVRLVQHQILAGGRKDGHGDRWWPVISRKLASDPRASVVWLLDATSEPIKRGRPAEIWTPHAGTRLDGEIWTPDAGSRFPGPEKSSTPSPKSSTPNPKSSTRMRGHETLDIRQDSLSGADAPGACATDLFAEGAPDQGGAPSDRATPSTKDAPCKPSSPEGSKKSERGSRLPDDWTLPDAWREHPRRRGLSEQQIDAVAKKFHGYWTTKTGEKAIRTKWPRVWDNWVDNQIDTYGLKPAGRTDAAVNTPPDCDAALKQLIASPFGQRTLERYGAEEGMKILRARVAANKRGATSDA